MDISPMIKGIQPAAGSASADKRQQAELKSGSAESAITAGNSEQNKSADKANAHGSMSEAHLSEEVTQLSTDNLTQSIKEQPDIDEEKITVIKNAIANGEYPLDTHKIAQAFLTLESVLN